MQAVLIELGQRLAGGYGVVAPAQHGFVQADGGGHVARAPPLPRQRVIGLGARVAAGAQAVAFDRFGRIAPLFQRAGQREQVLAAFHRFGAVHLPAQEAQELRQAYDVLPVMRKDALDGREVAVAQVTEIGLRHLGAGQIVLALYMQKLLLQVGQIAALQAKLPQPARGVEHIGMHGGQT